MPDNVLEDLKIRLAGGPISWPRPAADRELFERSLKRLCDLQAQVVTLEENSEQLCLERTRYEHEMQSRMNLRLRTEIAHCTKPSAELVAVLQANNKKLKEELDEANEDIAVNDVADLRKEISDLKESLKNSDEVMTLRKEVKKLNEILNKGADEIVDLRKTVKRLNEDLSGRVNKNIELHKEIHALNAALNNPVNEVADLRKEIKRLNEALAGRVDAVVGLRAGRHEWHVEKDRLIKEITVREEDRTVIKNKISEQEKEIKNLEIELAEHRRIWPFVKRAAEEVEYAAKIGLPK